MVSDLGDTASDLLQDGGNAVSEIGDSVSDAVSDSDNNLNTPANATAQVPLGDVSGYSTVAQGWGQGKNVDGENRPEACLQYQQKYGELGGVFLGADEPVMTLTFDEGYENGYTAQILDTLKEKQVSAVFFCTLDYIDGNPELVQRMIDEGHVVANHSASHASTPTLTAEEVAQEIQEVHQVVQEEFGYTMTLFRNPEGSFCERDLAIAQALGYESVFWSFAYVDWVVDDQPDPAESLTRLVEAVHPGAIYLLHPVSSTNAAILGDFIDQARAQGYEFTSEITPLET
ncbi:MAG TPA: polysaccharide deacetylase family protein [Candidatus Egerieicola faecale]|uniref:Polysaccharide deacetylase family protein n=1 Tax=Candidatus Egerieicola faecale TaxID=2840774 RepID=A0A9D1LHK3_9FIRM|nr:polysaccharide deacetylase family protein [Candidatus Egerieicola faecale]